MASSWKETGHPPPHRDEEDHDQEEEQDHNYDDLDKKEASDEEWLQLGLGLNCSRRRSSSTSMIVSTTRNSSISSSRLISCWKAPQDHHQDHDDHDQEIFVDSSNQKAPNFINMIMVSSTTHQTTHDHHHMGPSNYPASINNISSTVHHDHGDAADAAAAASGSGSGSFLFGGVHHEHYCHDSQTNMAVPAVITTTPPPPPPNSISLRSSSSSSTTTRATPSSTGLWFTLCSSLNRELGEKGQALPQIPKAYIRVKDENVTIFMVKKYLVRKLGLSNEAEIDIWCMGQNLMHTQTLKQVRDGVWLPRLVESVNSAAAAASAAASFDDDDADQQQHLPLTFSNHLMSLHYGRRYIFN